ncbi:MAG: CDP-diacylglycerol--glycerol-3-phosphate 3-phosphatidyltransferase [Acidobacteria bacterium]|nr:CDP-diacylglycerol--glycerol-3-phosphate 3-phosphatidyltransferase [Acidobacteriota bacterium]
MNLPNTLTLIRIFLVPLLVVVLLTRVENFDLWAIAILFSAALTDLLDGYLARTRGQVTTLGILLDPIADKLLISAAFISLVELRLVPAWVVVIIVGREFAVLGLRNIASAEGFTISASDLGKAKMALQVVAVSLIVVGSRYAVLRPWGKLALGLVVVFALISAVDYFRDFWRKLDVRIKQRPAGLAILRRLSEARAERLRARARKKPQDVVAQP